MRMPVLKVLRAALVLIGVLMSGPIIAGPISSGVGMGRPAAENVEASTALPSAASPQVMQAELEDFGGIDLGAGPTGKVFSVWVPILLRPDCQSAAAIDPLERPPRAV